MFQKTITKYTFSHIAGTKNIRAKLSSILVATDYLHYFYYSLDIMNHSDFELLTTFLLI